MYLILSKQKLNKNVLVDISEPHFFQRSTLNLQKGDEILLETYYISTGAYLWGNHYTYFSGYLLEEKITVA